MCSVKLHLIFFCCYLAICYTAVAQKNTPAIEREVTLNVLNESAGNVLSQIASQTGIKFSYSPAFIPADKKVSFYVNRKPVRTVLKIMFGETVQYRQKGNFIILTAKALPPPQMIIKEVTISGYVYDDRGEKLAYASILNKKEQTAAVTNQYGYYKIQVTADKLPLDLKVEKENYADTTLKINAKQTSMDIVLNPLEKPAPVIVMAQPLVKQRSVSIDTVMKQAFIPTDTSKKFIDQFFLSDETKANIRNLKDTLFSKVQFSVIPQASTNRLLVGNTVNDISFSLFVGYSKGINIAAFSGMINAVSGNVKYAQFAGIGNFVQENVTGAQAAGIINITDGNITGGQAAGIINITGGDVKYFQAAGIGNITDGNMEGAQVGGLFNITGGHVKGAQVGGLFNTASGYLEGAQTAGLFNNMKGNITGPQIAGITNITHGNLKGSQIAGICNIQKGNSAGFQLAGLFNVASKNAKGVQIAGFMNIADSSMEGIQIAGFINDTKHLKGIQIGFLNFSDSSSGTPLGFMSYSKKGYHKIELFADEIIQTQFAFRTGVEKFHNIFTVGFDFSGSVDGLWGFGYGLGTALPVAQKWKFNAELMSQVFLKKGEIQDAPQVNSFFIGIERSFGKTFSVTLGPVYRIMVNYSGSNEIADIIVPYTFYDRTFSNGNTLNMWTGAKLSLKFL